MKLTKHFTLEELVESDYAIRQGIDSSPSKEVERNLLVTAKGLEECREELLNSPIIVTSGYRCPIVNAAVGGSEYSSHIQGLAADFKCPSFGSPYKVAVALSKSSIQFDQLIYEGNWVHISFREGGARRQLKTAKFVGGVPHYMTGIRE